MDCVYCRSARMSALKVGDEAILVPISPPSADLNQCYRLNEVAAFVWERIDGRRSVSELASAVCREFAAEFPQVRSDLDCFLRQLEAIGAVSVRVHDRRRQRSSIH